MANNLIQDGSTIEHTAAGALTGGQGLAIGDRTGVVHEDVAAAGTKVTVHMEGVWSLPANANVSVVGADVYWTGTQLTTSAGGNVPAGQCWRAEANGFAHVKLGPTSTPGA